MLLLSGGPLRPWRGVLDRELAPMGPLRSALVGALRLLVIRESNGLQFRAFLPGENTAGISEVAAVDAAATNHGSDAGGARQIDVDRPLRRKILVALGKDVHKR
mgnify:CR=1 FL=1